MNTKQSQQLYRARQVQEFLDVNSHVVPPALVAPQRRVLDRVVREFEARAEEQRELWRPCSRAGGVIEVRRYLIDGHLRPIVAIANYSEKLAGAPLRAPSSKTTGYVLVAEAKEIAGRVRPIAGFLYAHGLAPNFMARLVSAIELVEDAEATARGRKRCRRWATRELARQVRVVGRVVRVLDALVRSRVAGSSMAKGKWEVAKRA